MSATATVIKRIDKYLALVAVMERIRRQAYGETGRVRAVRVGTSGDNRRA